MSTRARAVAMKWLDGQTDKSGKLIKVTDVRKQHKPIWAVNRGEI